MEGGDGRGSQSGGISSLAYLHLIRETVSLLVRDVFKSIDPRSLLRESPPALREQRGGI